MLFSSLQDVRGLLIHSSRKVLLKSQDKVLLALEDKWQVFCMNPHRVMQCYQAYCSHLSNGNLGSLQLAQLTAISSRRSQSERAGKRMTTSSSGQK